MKFSSSTNFGFGRSMNFAIGNVLADKYGNKKYGTCRAHEGRLKHFAEFLKATGVADLREIERNHVVDYAAYVRELCEEVELSVSYGNNLVSSANVLVGLLTNGACPRVSPSKTVGRRSHVRTSEPCGLDPAQYEPAVECLIETGHERLALTIAFCRLIGARFREASLLSVRSARRSANRFGEVVICRGSKGGRAKKIPRRIEAPDYLVRLLNDVAPKLGSRTVIPSDQNYVTWYATAHRQWRSLCDAFGMNSKFHDLRAAFACERHQVLSGFPAPCVSERIGVFEELPLAQQLPAAETRRTIALLLGHTRSDVVASYVGRMR